ncbi:MAG TPA: lytic transglycosylase domain-containing protein [Thermoleophilaceae bacterium]|nr:lytic transglycosylase domain-containing protein [Thermoleophilaceae bacterium]
MSPTTAERRAPRDPRKRGGPARGGGGRGGGASGARGRRPRRARRIFGVLAALLVGGGAAFLVVREEQLEDAVRELTLPLRHEDVIRQQADDKDLDPALIAAIIYEESRFRPRTSPAGAKGLMQIVPGTARFIARRSGGSAFELRDLGTPQINIAYGSWYLRYLLDRYRGEEELAVAAYNAGERNVDTWVSRAGGAERFDPQTDIAFPETRHYVAGVMKHRDEYARHYAGELGL